MKVLVIGGGASGLTAALTASEDPHSDVHLAERQARVARKLLATGNGRCNLTNRDMDLSHYHGTAPQFCLPALEAFGVEQTLAWFRSMGLLTVTEPGGRVYPASDSANSVADVLRLTLAGRQNVTLHAGCEITELRRTKGGFSVRLGDESCLFDRVIVCAGGAAGGKLGGTDLGYRLLTALGHSRTKLQPSLVQLRTEPTWVRSLKGVRCEVRAVLKTDGGRTERAGELQFTDYGVSGPVIFELSRAAAQGGLLLLDLLPDVPAGELTQLLQARQGGPPPLALIQARWRTGSAACAAGRRIICPSPLPCRSCWPGWRRCCAAAVSRSKRRAARSRRTGCRRSAGPSRPLLCPCSARWALTPRR